MKIKIYFCLAIIILSALVLPLKALAVDYGFFSANDILFYDSCGESTGNDDGTLTGDNNKEKIWCYLITKFGLSKGGAAGLMGNMQRESGFIPDKWQEYPEGICDDKFVENCGYGLVQWTYTTFRKTGPDTLWKFAGETFPNTSGKVGTLKTQLDYLYFTFTEWADGPDGVFGTMYEKLKKEILPKDAAFIYLKAYGQPSADKSGDTNQKGVRFAKAIYNELKDLPCGNTTSSSAPVSSAASAPVSSAASTSGAKPKILIGPGHTGSGDTRYSGPSPGIKDTIYGNDPELQDVWDVAQKVKTALLDKGYEVLMTKNKVDDNPFSWDRTQKANNNNVDLAFEIHTDSTSGSFGNWGSVWSQFQGGYANDKNGNKVNLVADDSVIEKSKTYAKKFATARKAAGENNIITETTAGFYDKPDPQRNITLVQLWSKVPWIYLEAGADASKVGLASGGITDAQKEIYATGIINGVVASIPPGSGTANTTDCGGSGSGNASSIVDWALNLAWNTEGHSTSDAKPLMKSTYIKYYSLNDWYYSACNEFVGTVMHASGADTNYEKGVTNAQQGYLMDHSNKFTRVPNFTSENQLEPGDLMVSNVDGRNYHGGAGHVWIYVGAQTDGSGPRRDASFYGHAPESGTFYTDAYLQAYRLK